jgi:hypothetical protein
MASKSSASRHGRLLVELGPVQRRNPHDVAFFEGRVLPEPLRATALPIENVAYDFRDEPNKESRGSQGQSASELISSRIAELGDWREETLSRKVGSIAPYDSIGDAPPQCRVAT